MRLATRCILVCSLLAPDAVNAAPFVRGEVTADAEVNISDAILAWISGQLEAARGRPPDYRSRSSTPVLSSSFVRSFGSSPWTEKSALHFRPSS